MLQGSEAVGGIAGPDEYMRGTGKNRLLLLSIWFRKNGITVTFQAKG